VTIARPVVLLLLPVVIAVLVASLYLLPGRERTKRRLSLIVRSVLLALLVLALAGIYYESGSEGRAVSFLIDVSRSIPPERSSAVGEWLERARAHRRSNDLEQVVLFADGAAVEVSFGEEGGTPVDLERPHSRIEREASDLAGAIRLARSSFPQGPARRIVVVTDGNENRGDAVAEARRAAGDGVEILVLPVEYSRTEETAILRIDAVSVAPPQSVVTFVPILSSTMDAAPARLHAFVNGQPIGSEEIVLAKGKTRGPEFRVQLGTSGIYDLSVSLESDADTILRNNESRASVRVLHQAGVLVVEGEAGSENHMAALLRSMDIPVVEERPAGLFHSPLAYQPYDAVVLSDVTALDLTSSQLDALEVAVRDLGLGCLVLGGDQAYGPGAYRNTALERLLPVNMEIRQKQVLLNGALVLILHTCEFQNGNYWAQRIAQDSILALTPKDYAGLIIYGMGGDDWLLELQPVLDPPALAAQISDIPAGDMPSFDSSLKLAADALKTCKAHLKHIVVISDGDAAQPNPILVGQIVADHITVSTVCVAPHGPNDSKMMAKLARWGRGRHYDIKAGEVESLPRIFIKEATTLRRNSVSRKPFRPKFTAVPADLPPLLRGFGAELPELDAYVLTEAKERAEVPIVTPDGDPVLAIWRYGLGETAAFTSAMKGGWLGDWTLWPELDRFFSQVVRGLLRKADRSGFHATASCRGGVATVRLNALTDDGDALDFLEITATAVRGGEEPRSFPMHQKGGGSYEGTFPVRGEGTWLAILRYTDPETGRLAQLELPVAVSYPEEFADLTSNAALFSRLADEAGARLLDPDDDVFAGDADGGRMSRSLAGLFLVLAALLLPVDIYLRRVRPDLSKFFSRFTLPRISLEKLKPAARLPAVPDFEPEPEAPPEDAKVRPSLAALPEESAEAPMSDLLKAKKRARDKRRWEETGNE